ncbi:TonB-dependent receptor plug domain-containing protein [Thermodesulfovibrio hydrogeniphilus]
MILFLVLILSLLFSSQAFAAQESVLDEIVVTASKTEETVRETSASVVVITEEDIKKLNVQFLPDVLRTVADLNITQTGGIGSQTSIFLRGGASKHTLILVDGVKVNSPTTGDFDFSHLSVNDIERIEIIKGPQSTIYGSEAMAGVINIITKKGKGKPSITASFEGGSYGTYSSTATFQMGTDKYDLKLTASYFKTEGISAYKNGTERDGYKNASVSTRLGIKPLENLEFELIGGYTYARKKVDFCDYFNPDSPLCISYSYRNFLNFKTSWNTTKFWHQIISLSRFQDIYKTRDREHPFAEVDIDSNRYLIDWQNNFSFSDMHITTGGFEYKKDKAENPSAKIDHSVENKAFYLNNKFQIIKEILTINVGLRYDKHETFGDHTTYRVGSVVFIKDLDLRLEASYGTGFRAPSLNDLYYKDDWGFSGNPNLKPEKSRGWDVGFDKEFLNKKLYLSIKYFNQKYTDLIAWKCDPLTRQCSPINISQAKAKGIESSLNIKISKPITFTVGYTYLDAKNDKDEPLDRRPRNKASFGLGYADDKFNIYANLIYVDRRKDGIHYLPSYSVFNLSGDYKISKNITIFGRVQNLFNNKYEEAYGYGTYGTSVFLGTRVSL